MTAQIPGIEMLGAISPVAWVVAFACFFTTITIGVPSYLLSLMYAQLLAQRDRRRILNNSIESPPIYLYLRSFDAGRSTLIGRVQKLFDSRIANLSPFWPRRYPFHDPEEQLAEAVNSVGRLVAIGNRSASYGAAKLKVSDEQWQNTFIKLANSSRQIFIVPALSEGLLWEAQTITGQPSLAAKTVFVMPRNWYSDEWEELRIKWRTRFSIELPPYQAQGGYFCAGINSPSLIDQEQFISALKYELQK